MSAQDLAARTRLDRGSIFDSISQIITDDPATMRPLFDRLLIRDVHDEEVSPGGIVLTAAPSLGGLGKSGRMRRGDVVQIGPGDMYHAWNANGRINSRSYSQRSEMLCRVGDMVVIDRRKEAEFYIDGVRYSICSENQAIYGRMVPKMVNVPHGEARNRSELLVACYFKQEFECLYDRVLVEPRAPVQTGLIARPDNATPEQFREGIVRSVGQGFRHFDGKIHELSVKPGDRVLYRAEGGGGAARPEAINLFGEELVIMREKLIWAVLKP